MANVPIRESGFVIRLLTVGFLVPIRFNAPWGDKPSARDNKGFCLALIQFVAK